MNSMCGGLGEYLERGKQPAQPYNLEARGYRVPVSQRAEVRPVCFT